MQVKNIIRKKKIILARRADASCNLLPELRVAPLRTYFFFFANFLELALKVQVVWRR